MHDIADATFQALADAQHAPDLTPYRLHLYVARVALAAATDALAHLAAQEPERAADALRTYRRLAKGLIHAGYWSADPETQTGVPADGAR